MTRRASQKPPRHEPRRKLVYGEPAHTIKRAFANAEVSPEDDEGFCEFRIGVTHEEVGPFVRAVLRAQAEPLLKEADLFEPGAPLPNSEDLQAMAVLAVACAAVESTSGAPPGA